MIKHLDTINAVATDPKFKGLIDFSLIRAVILEVEAKVNEIVDVINNSKQATTDLDEVLKQLRILWMNCRISPENDYGTNAVKKLIPYITGETHFGWVKNGEEMCELCHMAHPLKQNEACACECHRFPST